MKVQITLNKNQDHYEAEEQLFKALETQREGATHDTEVFLDPAMEHHAELMKAEYKTVLDTMITEILEVLDEEL